MVIKIPTIILILIMVMNSCASKKVLQKEYFNDSQIILTDFYFDSRSRNDGNFKFEKDDSHLSIDSLLGVFISSLNQLNLSFILIDEINRLDGNIRDEKSRKIDTDTIIRIGMKYPSKTVFIPLIQFRNAYYPFSEIYLSTLRISVFLVKDNQIIYSNREESSVSVRHVDYNNYEELIRHSQEEWDELVKNVMQPYINRLK